MRWDGGTFDGSLGDGGQQLDGLGFTKSTTRAALVIVVVAMVI